MADRVVTYVLRGSISDLTAKMTAAGASVGKVAKEMTALDAQGAKMRRGFSTIGDTAGKMGLVAAVGFGAVVAATLRFDKQMSAVQAATHESADAMGQLREAAIAAGADTAFSATEAAQGIEELAKAGVATQDILGGGLKGALDLAAAGALGVGESAEIAATALTQFSLDGADVPHVADLLAASAGKAQGSVTDMGMALKQSGLVAAQTGLTIEETTGTLAAFAASGLVGSDSGTSFKTMLQALTPTGKKAADEMERLGITAYDAQGNFVGMTTFADSLKSGLKDLSVEQQNAAMKTIFGSDAVRAAAVVFEEGGAGIQSWIDKVDDSGYAAETAGLRMDNLAGDFEKLKGALETALIGSGEGSTGPLREMTQAVTGLVDAYNSLPGPIKNGAVAALALTAALGGSVFVASKAVAGYSNVKTGIADLGASFDKANKRALAFRGGALAASAGLVALSSPAHSASRELGTLADTAAGAALGFAVGGPWGAAIGGGVALLGSLTSSSSSATSNLDGLTATLDQQTGAIGENTAAWVTKRLQDSGAADALKALGISLATATDAALGNKDAMKEVADATERGSFVGEDALATVEGLSGGIRDGAKATSEATDATSKSVEAQKAAAPAAAELTEAQQKLNEANRSTAESFIDLSDDADQAKESLSSWIKDLASQADALNNFTANAQRAGKKGLDEGLIDSLREMGPEGAARLKDLADASDAEIERANRAWRKGQRAIERYVDAFGEVPEGVETKVTTPGVGRASANVGSLIGQLNKLDGMNVSAMVHIGLSGANLGAAIGQINKIKNSADGNIFDFYADGGTTENHVAQIASADTVRVWAEPETGGEAYIPFALSKRKRSQQIAMETVSRLGGVAAFANGGTTGSGSGSSGGHILPPGAQFRLVGSDLIELVDSRVSAGTAGASRHNAARTRAGRK